MQAAFDVRSLITNNKNNSTAYYLLGCIYEKKGELERSIESFNKAIETDSNNVNALFSRGAVYNMLGNYQKAIDDYYLALETDSKRKTVYRNFGKVLGLSNETTESERNFNYDQNNSSLNNSSKTSDLGNLNIDGDINLYVYSQLNDLAIRNTNLNLNQNAGKIADLDSKVINLKELKSSTSNSNSLLNAKKTNDFLSDNSYTGMSYNTNNHGISSYNNENEEDSFNNINNKSKNCIQISRVEVNEKYGEKSKNNLDIYSDKKDRKKNMEKWEVCHAQGYAARKKENYTLAVDCYTQALSLQPKYFKALFNRGFAYDKMGDYDKAIHDYTKAIELEPNNAYAYYNRAISYDKKGDMEKTIEDFTSSIKLLPTKIDFYLNRAYAYRKIKDYQNAIKDYTDVINLHSDSMKVKYI